LKRIAQSMRCWSTIAIWPCFCSPMANEQHIYMGGLYLHGSHHAHRQLQLCQIGPTLLLYIEVIHIYIYHISYIYIHRYIPLLCFAGAVWAIWDMLCDSYDASCALVLTRSCNGASDVKTCLHTCARLQSVLIQWPSIAFKPIRHNALLVSWQCWKNILMFPVNQLTIILQNRFSC
jgi:hypothetical protein